MNANERESFCVAPVVADADVHNERDVQLVDVLHFALHHL